MSPAGVAIIETPKPVCGSNKSNGTAVIVTGLTFISNLVLYY